MTTECKKLSGWALVLGASSGFGEAVCKELADCGMNIFGVHLDRRPTLPKVEEIKTDLKSKGVRVEFFNINAADDTKREEVLDQIKDIAGDEPVRVLVHSLAFGSLRPFWNENGEMITSNQMEMTMDVMASSLVYWAQGLLKHDLIRSGGRIFAMTSAGGTHVWPNYGAVSAAKAALESNCRQLAFELASKGITANAIMAGVTDTPALRKIAGHEKMVELARMHNPSGRLTLPEDVAKAISLLADERSYWINGNVIAVDGGEYIAD